MQLVIYIVLNECAQGLKHSFIRARGGAPPPAHPFGSSFLSFLVGQCGELTCWKLMVPSGELAQTRLATQGAREKELSAEPEGTRLLILC